MQRKAKKKVNEHGKYLLKACKAAVMHVINGNLCDAKNFGN